MILLGRTTDCTTGAGIGAKCNMLIVIRNLFYYCICVCAFCEMALAQLLIYNFHGKFIHLTAVVVVGRYKQNKQLAGSVAQLLKFHRGGISGDTDRERLLSKYRMLNFLKLN